MNTANRKMIEETKELRLREEDFGLVGRVAAGDPAAQRQFVMRLMPQVRRTMSYMTNDIHLAEDMTQNALVRLLAKAGTYRGESSLKFWASRVSSHMALNEFKKLARQRRNNSQLPQPVPTFHLADKAAVDLMIKQKLSDMLSKLKEKHRIVLVLKHIEGYSVAEIASLVAAPENTVRERLRTGRAKLRKAVDREPELVRQVLGREAW